MIHKTTTTYVPPQTYAEPYDLDAQLCQASGATFDDPDPLDGAIWTD